MMKKIVSSILFSLAACLSLYSQANTDIIKTGLKAYSNDYGFGGTARFSGMGGSMGALGGDMSAAIVNPAGLGVFMRSSGLLTTQIHSFSEKIRLGNTRTNDDTRFNLTQAAGVFVIDIEDEGWRNINLGFTYDGMRLDHVQVFPKNNAIRYFEVDTFDNPTIPNFYTYNGYTNYMDGNKYRFAIQAGANYDDRIFIGMGLNVHSSDFFRYSRLFEFETANPNFTYRSNAIDTPISESSNGISFNLGVIGRVNQVLRLGLAYQSPLWTNFLQQTYNTFSLFSGSLYQGEFISGFYDDIRVTAPGRLTASAAAVFGSNLALNVDYSLIFNRELKFVDRQDPNFYLGENEFIDNFFRTSSEVRLGGEYRYKRFRFRAGGAYRQSPTETLSINPIQFGGNYTMFNPVYNYVINPSGNQVPSHSSSNFLVGDMRMLSFGIGYNFGSFFLDFALQNNVVESQQIFGGYFADIDNDFLILRPAHVVDVRNRFNNFFITLGFNF